MFFGMKSTKLGSVPIGRATPYMTSNTAPHGTVSYSSNYSTAYGFQAFDTNLATSWTAGYVPNGWIQFKLSSVKTIGSFRYKTSSLPERAPKNYNVKVSLDGIVWTTVLDVLNEPQLASEGYIPIRKFDLIPCRYIKLTIDSTHENVNALSIADIEYIEYKDKNYNGLNLVDKFGTILNVTHSGTSLVGWENHSENNSAPVVIAQILNKGGFDCIYLQTGHTAEASRRWYEVTLDSDGNVITANDSYILRYKYYDSIRGLTVESSAGSRWYTTIYLDGPALVASETWQQYESLPFVIPFNWIGLVMNETWNARLNIRDIELVKV